MNKEEILEQISSSVELQNMWRKYQQKFSYAKNISYDDVMEKLKILVNCI